MLGDSNTGLSLQTSEDKLRSSVGLPVKPANASPLSALTKAVARSSKPDLKLIYYTGHTLQGSYKGAFVYSKSVELTPEVLATAKELISNAGLNPNEFCIVRNQCFLDEKPDSPNLDMKRQNNENNEDAPQWYIGERFFQLSRYIAAELADWFEDPTILSDWLVEQQQRVVFENPLAVSPFADLGQAGKERDAAEAANFAEQTNAPKGATVTNVAKDVLSINGYAFRGLFNKQGEPHFDFNDE